MPSELACPIRLLLIDDHALFREGIARLLASEPDLEVVAMCDGIQCGLEKLRNKQIDLVLLDFDLGNERAIDFVHSARTLQATAKILIVTAGVDERSAAQLIQAGVSGIFHKQNDPQTFSSRIRSIVGGEVFLEETYLKCLFRLAQPQSEPVRPRLTNRERAVLQALLEGLPNKLIADRLSTSETSVKGIIQQLFQKTGVRTRSQLVRLALERFNDEL
jgi:two-component system nitrate/nitrite response regulator NarL